MRPGDFPIRRGYERQQTAYLCGCAWAAYLRFRKVMNDAQHEGPLKEARRLAMQYLGFPRE